MVEQKERVSVKDQEDQTIVERQSGFSVYSMCRDSSRSALEHAVNRTSRHGSLAKDPLADDDADKKKEPWTLQDVLRLVFFLLLFLFGLWVFMVGLKIMGDAFKTLAGCEAGSLFSFAGNPIAGLMIGVLSTVLVQSSSTTTSIVVSLVGSKGMTVKEAIPVIMGANIGTTITSTLVACGQISDRTQFQRAFTAATVHDMFNVLAVLILLPLESITHVIFEITSVMIPDDKESGSKMTSPIDVIVKPISKQFLQVNKTIIKESAKSSGYCDNVDTILKGGMFHGHTSDAVAGGVSLVVSLILVIGSLLLIVKILNILLMSAAEQQIRKALSLNGYLMMIIGAVITFLVQSSSIVTSVLTPLVGVDLITVEKMFPMVLGANIGTTGTAFIAALISGEALSVQIALCHLFFNVFGILIWYPIHYMRRIPLSLAKTMGWTASCIRWFPVAYILSIFVALPGVSVGLSVGYSSGTVGIVISAIFSGLLLIAFIAVIVWWNRFNGRGKVISWIEARAGDIDEDDKNEKSIVENDAADIIKTPTNSTAAYTLV